MSRLDEAYEAYVVRCHGLGIQAMSRIEYDNFISKMPLAGDNNTDAILRNNNRKKDKNDH